MLKATAQYTPRGDLGQFVKARITPAVREAVARSCDIVVEEAKTIVPVRTGELRDSIHATEPQDREHTVVGSVVADAPHAGYVEYGTGIRGAASEGAGPYPYSATWPGMAARPYLRPALDAARERIREEFESAISMGVKQ
jgi:HK97 gp10 family phage protein